MPALAPNFIYHQGLSDHEKNSLVALFAPHVATTHIRITSPRRQIWHFSLEPGGLYRYATMLVRQLMKGSTSAGAHKKLTEEAAAAVAATKATNDAPAA